MEEGSNKEPNKRDVLGNEVMQSTRMLSDDDVREVLERYGLTYIPGNDTIYRLCMVVSTLETKILENAAKED